jgi:hypothetical protein
VAGQHLAIYARHFRQLHPAIYPRHSLTQATFSK